MRLVPLLLLALAAAGCISPDADRAQDDARAPQGDGSEPSPPSSCAPVPPENVNTGVDAGSSASASNQPGAFSYSRQGVVTASKVGYVWENPAPTSRLSASMQGSGTVRVQVFDACGASILDRTLEPGSGSSSEALPEGTPGDWTVQLTFAAFSGAVSLSVTS